MIQDRVIDVRPKHTCSSTCSISLCCIDDSGMFHVVCTAAEAIAGV